MWNFWVGIPQKPFKWGQLAPSPSSFPLPRAVYSASVPLELLSTFLSLLWVQEADLYGTHQKVPLPSEFQQEMEPGRAEKSKCFSSGLPLCQAIRGQWLLPSVKGHSSSQADISDHYSCSSRWIPATIPCPYPFTLRSGNASLLLLTPGFLIIPCSFPFTLPTPL